MSEETPNVDPKHYQPTNGEPLIPLVPHAQTPFRVMVITGSILIALAAILLFVGMSQDGYGEDGTRLAAWLLAGLAALFSPPFFAAAGIIAALGQRQEAPATKTAE